MLYDHHTSFIPFCLAYLCCTSYRKLYRHSCLWRFMETTWKFKQWLRCTIGPSTSTLTAQVPHCAFLAIVPNSITSWDFTNIEPTKKVATCNVHWHKDTKLHCALLSYVQNPSISSMGVMRLTCHPSGSAIIAAITTILFWIHVTQLWEQALVLVVCVG